MRKSAKLEAWLASEELATRKDFTYLLRGDVMHTRIYRNTRSYLKENEAALLGAVNGLSPRSFSPYQRLAFELGKSLSAVTNASYCCHDNIQAEFLRRCRIAPEAAEDKTNFLARESWSRDSATELERRAWWLQLYVRQPHNARQPHLVRMLSDERVLDVILWRKLTQTSSD